MQCPQCGAEAGAAEFCPACLAQVGPPAKTSEEVERDLEQKDREERKVRLDALLRQGRLTLIWIGAIAVAVSVGAAIASVVASLSDGTASAPASAEREPRVRCRGESDCGTDPCGRPIACESHACVRKTPGPCPETQRP